MVQHKVKWLVIMHDSYRDSATRFSTSGFFHESVSPKPLSIPSEPFRKFADIFAATRRTTAVKDTGGKWKKSSIREVLNILYGHLWVVELTYFFLQVHFKV
jgi:hypothetical protein